MNKAELVEKLQDRFGGELTKLLLTDAVDVIINHMEELLLEHKSISINNFGTLHTMMIKDWEFRSALSKKIEHVDSYFVVAFRPHITFLTLLKEKIRREQRNS